jgi:GT2 family glycosyltransferase
MAGNRFKSKEVVRSLPDGLQRSKSQVSDPPLLFVIVLNWNLKDDLAECLASLERSTYSSFRVVVVDNASDDGSAEMVQARFPAVHLIVNERNLGFAGGNNVGLRYALTQGAEYVFLINNDTLAAPDMLERLVAVAHVGPSPGILGPKILYHGTEDRVWYLGHRTYDWLPVPRRVAPRLGKCPGALAWFDVDYVSGCGMLIRHDVLKDIGLLDERLFMHYEDADFCWRTRQAGYRVVCVPGARMWHKVSQSSRREAAAVSRTRVRNRVLFYRQHPHGPHPWLTTVFLLASTGIIMARDLLRGEFELIRSQGQGLYEGFTERLYDGK